MDKRNENCGLPYDRCYYPHWSRDSLSPVCRFFFYVIGSGPELQDKEEEKTYAAKNLKAQQNYMRSRKKENLLISLKQVSRPI